MLELETNGIQIENQPLPLKGTMVSTAHNNLGAHTMVGMTQSFSALYSCRFCSIEVNDSKAKTSAKDLPIRTKYCEGINGTETLDPKKTFGFIRQSELNFLKYFNLALGTSGDPFHDFNEGT